MTDPIQSAIDQLMAYGLSVDNFIADGRLRRVKTTDDKGSKKSGWYVAHEFTLRSGRSVITGRFGNWKASNEPIAFKFDAAFTDEEKAAFKAQQERQRQAADKEKRERHKQAAERAAKIWPSLPTDGHSDYLARKKIHGFGCRFGKGGSIAVPLYKGDQITGLQWIAADGSKKFLTGTEKQGAAFTINPDGKPAICCEGYATGCSIAMALPGARVDVAFDAGNLLMMDAIYQREDAIIAADNDHLKPENAGLTAAAHIQRRYPHVKVVYPVFKTGDTGTDFNDLHVSHGLDAVREAITASTAQAFPRSVVETIESKPSGGNQLPRKPPAVGGGGPSDPHWRDRLKRGKASKPENGEDQKPGPILALSSNIDLILEHDPKWSGVLSYCDFSYRIIKRNIDLPDMIDGEWEDADTARLAIWLSNVYGFEPGRNKITDAIIVAAQRNRFHPVRDYLISLTWDGKPRIDKWLDDIYEAEGNSEYIAAVGSKFLIGAVARVMDPGCKMDHVMILEGRQGLRKSTSIAQLFGDWFSDAPIPIGDKDAYQNIQGVWCSELAELDSFNKAESTSAKMFFSQVRDRYRPSYGLHAQDFKRQTIFVGTTNQGEYLKDYTGNRRYWPVKCHAARIDLLQQNRDQYWAEAVHRYRHKEPWWPDDSTREIFEEEQDARMQIDPWHYRIADWIESRTDSYFQANDIISNALEKDMAQVTRADQNRISPIMHKLGFVNVKKRIDKDKKKAPRHVYVRRSETK